MYAYIRESPELYIQQELCVVNFLQNKVLKLYTIFTFTTIFSVSGLLLFCIIKRS